MFDNMEYVRELNSQFKLFRSHRGSYEVYPNDVAWDCILRGTLGGNVDDAWAWRGGEDVTVFIRDGETFHEYHFDYWQMLLNEVNHREPFNSYSVSDSSND